MRPEREFNLGGWRPMKRYRLRNTWRGAVLEGLWECISGEVQWRREMFPVSIDEVLAQSEIAA